jgi:hypothetical protein
MVDTDARFNVKDVGKINFFIYIFDLTTRGGDEDTCHLQASTPSSLQHLRPGPRVGAPRTRSGCVVVAGFLGGSRGLADTPRFLMGGGRTCQVSSTPPPIQVHVHVDVHAHVHVDTYVHMHMHVVKVSCVSPICRGMCRQKTRFVMCPIEVGRLKMGFS